jgi:hypothetical protein
MEEILQREEYCLQGLLSVLHCLRKVWLVKHSKAFNNLDALCRSRDLLFSAKWYVIGDIIKKYNPSWVKIWYLLNARCLNSVLIRLLKLIPLFSTLIFISRYQFTIRALSFHAELLVLSRLVRILRMGAGFKTIFVCAMCEIRKLQFARLCCLNNF